MAEPCCSECGCPRDPLNAHEWKMDAGRHRAEAFCVRALGRALAETRAQLADLVRGVGRLDGALAPVPLITIAPRVPPARAPEPHDG